MLRVLALIISFCCFSEVSFAATQPFFPTPEIAVITVQGSRLAQDPDAGTLYEGMNVVPQQTLAGPAKYIDVNEKQFEMVCGDNPNAGHACTIAIKASSYSQISPREQRVKLEYKGEIAKQLWSLFHYAEDGAFAYTTRDGKLRIKVTAEHFMFEFN